MKEELATFAGGCFWCMESALSLAPGVIDVVSGYTGGKTADPTYEQVGSGKTGHRESVQIRYDADKIGYEDILNVFWINIDPTDPGGMFADRGEEYTSAIFYHSAEQKRIAEKSKRELDSSGKFKKPIVTKILKYDKFYPAEEYHQDYAKKNPIRYKMYEIGSGREAFKREHWG